MIKRRARAGIIDFDTELENGKESEKISYCRHCLEYGFEIPLKNRIYPESEPKPLD